MPPATARIASSPTAASQRRNTVTRRCARASACAMLAWTYWFSSRSRNPSRHLLRLLEGKSGRTKVIVVAPVFAPPFGLGAHRRANQEVLPVRRKPFLRHAPRGKKRLVGDTHHLAPIVRLVRDKKPRVGRKKRLHHALRVTIPNQLFVIGPAPVEDARIVQRDRGHGPHDAPELLLLLRLERGINRFGPLPQRAFQPAHRFVVGVTEPSIVSSRLALVEFLEAKLEERQRLGAAQGRVAQPFRQILSAFGMDLEAQAGRLRRPANNLADLLRCRRGEVIKPSLAAEFHQKRHLGATGKEIAAHRGDDVDLSAAGEGRQGQDEAVALLRRDRFQREEFLQLVDQQDQPPRLPGGLHFLEQLQRPLRIVNAALLPAFLFPLEQGLDLFLPKQAARMVQGRRKTELDPGGIAPQQRADRFDGRFSAEQFRQGFRAAQRPRQAVEQIPGGLARSHDGAPPEGHAIAGLDEKRQNSRPDQGRLSDPAHRGDENDRGRLDLGGVRMKGPRILHLGHAPAQKRQHIADRPGPAEEHRRMGKIEGLQPAERAALRPGGRRDRIRRPRGLGKLGLDELAQVLLQLHLEVAQVLVRGEGALDHAAFGIDAVPADEFVERLQLGIEPSPFGRGHLTDLRRREIPVNQHIGLAQGLPRFTRGENLIFGAGSVLAPVRSGQRGAQPRPKNTDNQIELGSRRNLVLKIAVVPHRLVFPKIRLDRNAPRKFRGQPLDKSPGHAPFLINVPRR
jgi:hypothetical protein